MKNLFGLLWNPMNIYSVESASDENNAKKDFSELLWSPTSIYNS